jgi:Cys-tRNA(Pro)/Cys-tRNA(Cys) deacylase
VQRQVITVSERDALAAIKRTGIAYQIVRHGPVRSLEEAAAASGVAPADIIKTLVVRRAEDDFLFVLVPGDRTISWPKLRGLLGENRISMPDATVAKKVTGYERGTITPFGSQTSLPVIADDRVADRTVSIGAGEHDAAFTVNGRALVDVLGAKYADVTDPA